ncbi:MAG: hypothetical protein ACPLXM_04795 [Bacteroidales bacterium]
MKKHLPFFVLFLIFFQGCLEYEFTTRVNTDGSVDRTVIITGDSSDVCVQKVIQPLDTSWTTSFRKDTGDSRRWVLTAERSFKRAEDMKAYFFSDPDTGRAFSMDVSLRKKFRWFYTYFDYKETMLSVHPFRRIPVTQFITPEELHLLALPDNMEIGYSREKDRLISLPKDSLRVLNEKDSTRMAELQKDLEMRFRVWNYKSAFEEFYHELEGELYKSGEWETISRYKDSVWNAIEKEIKDNKAYDIFNGNGDSLRYDFTQNSGKNFIQAVLEDLEVISGQKGLLKLLQNRHFMFPVFMAKCRDFTFMTDDITFSLGMPGLLLNTNATAVAGNVCNWEVPETVQWANFEMVAESRAMNRWAFYVTGILILFLLIIFIGRLFR